MSRWQISAKEIDVLSPRHSSHLYGMNLCLLVARLMIQSWCLAAICAESRCLHAPRRSAPFALSGGPEQRPPVSQSPGLSPFRLPDPTEPVPASGNGRAHQGAAFSLWAAGVNRLTDPSVRVCSRQESSSGTNAHTSEHPRNLHHDRGYSTSKGWCREANKYKRQAEESRNGPAPALSLVPPQGRWRTAK